MKSRKERREEARANGVTFEPQYNGRVITKEQFDKERAEAKEARKKLKEQFKKALKESKETTTKEVTE